MKTKTITFKYNINYDETQVGLATPGTAAKITTFQRNRVSKRKYATLPCSVPPKEHIANGVGAGRLSVTKMSCIS